jgi:hypothetical protein
LTEAGAQWAAELVADELRAINSALAAYLK